MSMHDLFAEAVERLKAGEPAASIVASYPADMQAELSELLAIVEMADQVAVQPLPQRSARQRSRARARFLQQALAMRTEIENTLGAPALAQRPGNSPASEKGRAAQPSWRERLAMGWGSLFDSPLLRLAPLAVVAAAVYLAMFWTVRTAEAALPGDVVYPIKQWVREQKVSLAPPEQRVEAIREAQDQVALEVKTLATELASELATELASGLQTQPQARAELPLEHSEPMVYYGSNGNLLMIGPLLVAPNYQPDAGVGAFAPMVLEGALQPGATVQLTYRVLPGNPSVVQGVRGVVVDAPKPAPEPTATMPPIATSTLCQFKLPVNWVHYAVRPRDTLQGLANRSGASLDFIKGVNCMASNSLDGVAMLYVPDTVYVQVTPYSMPTPLPTVPPTLTLIPTATYIPQPTLTPIPPTILPTVLPTGFPTLVPTFEPYETPTIPPIDTPTLLPTLLPTLSPTSEPSVTAAPTPWPPTATPTITPFSTPIVPPTPLPPTPLPPTPLPPTPVLPTPLPPTPVEPPTPVPPTPLPPTPVLPTPEPPTPVPPTPLPPTPVPPTPLPPTPEPPTPLPPTPMPPPPVPPAPLPPAPEPPTPLPPTPEPVAPIPG